MIHDSQSFINSGFGNNHPNRAMREPPTVQLPNISDTFKNSETFINTSGISNSGYGY